MFWPWLTGNNASVPSCWKQVFYTNRQNGQAGRGRFERDRALLACFTPDASVSGGPLMLIGSAGKFHVWQFQESDFRLSAADARM